MSLTDLKKEVHQMIEHLDDSFLKIVHSMLQAHALECEDPIAGYDIYGQPRKASELMDDYESELDSVKRGEASTAAELKEKSQQWLSCLK